MSDPTGTSDTPKPTEDGAAGQARTEPPRLSVRDFYQKTRDELRLHPLTPLDEARHELTTPDIHRPGLVLAGFLDNFPGPRLQILGRTEFIFLESLPPEKRREALRNLCRFPIPCIILTRSLTPPPELLEEAGRSGIAVLQSEMETTAFIHTVQSILEEHFAPATTVHGTLVDVYGVGLLFTGRSGIGKSECALDLVERGHRLVADDIVFVKKRHDTVLIGKGNELARHCMEIRGIGIIDVQAIFGIRAIRAQKRIEVEVRLKEWEKTREYERLGLTEQHTTILGVQIPLVLVPIFPGKNITVIAETIALNYLVKAYGYNPAEHFSEHLLQLMRRKANLDVLARDDLE
jgi:HPr kinase/phosphorylase